ncbi:MAG TPA: HEAT repeat domain-containing protein [Blastocatellia bacterium]|nr:HEAT repeat domain-containing protein [Blastocatellia bacterium]
MTPRHGIAGQSCLKVVASFTSRASNLERTIRALVVPVMCAVAIVVLPGRVGAQAPPTTPPVSRPTLKRDRTQRIIYPKIIQYEDERFASPELKDLINAPHPSAGVRARAIVALGRIGAGVADLIEVLNNDQSPRMRALAAFSLGEIESHLAVPALLDRLDPSKESAAEVRARVAEALGKITSNKQSAEALGKYGIIGINDALINLLPPTSAPPSADAKMIATKAITALLRLRQPSAVGPISGQLRSADADLRWQAANALARIREGISPAVPALLPLLDDKSELVRAHAARALGVAKASQAVQPLIRLLADPDERVVANAVVALGVIGDPKAADALIPLGNKLIERYRAFDRAKDGVPAPQNLLLLIATALGNIKDARALPFLNALRSIDGKPGPNPEVEIAIAKFGEAQFFDDAGTAKVPLGEWKTMAAYAQGLGQLGTDRAKQALSGLLAGTTYGKPDWRALSDILNAMSAAKVGGFRKVLLDQLKAEDVMVRATAATLLGELGEPSDEVINALKEAYKAGRADKMNDARIAILETAARLKRPMSVEALSELTRDPDYVVRLKALELLRESGADLSGQRLQVGKAETGHDRAYWKRIAELSVAVKTPVAVIHTKKGIIRIELFASDAPMTVDNFIQLSRRGFYDGLTFMRVVPNFVIQGGDPRNDMNGGPGYQIRCEINLREYGTGAVGMALSGKDTGGSQFFITHSPQPHLDGGYTVFGQVIEGMEVVNRIGRGDRIERVEILAPR